MELLVENQLFIDCWDGACFDRYSLVTEGTSPKGLVKFKGKFQEANAINKNKRMYTREILESNVDRLMECVKSRGLIGELDHPTDSIVHFSNASHIVTNLWWENNILMGEGEILNTPAGKVLKSLIDDDIRIGISSRGVGNGKVNENGILVIGESYKLITFDAVADPSTFSAFQEKVVTNKRENTNYYNYVDKNETTSINKINKEALLACLGGVISSRTKSIKEELR